MNAPIPNPYQGLQDELAGRAPDFHQHEPEWLQVIRQKALETFRGLSMPLRKTEHWKYSSVAALANDPAGNDRSDATVPEGSNAIRSPQASTVRIYLSGSGVRIEGQAPAGTVCTPLAEAQEADRNRISRLLQRSREDNLFAVLNAAAGGAQCLVSVPRDTSLSLEVIYQHEHPQGLSFPRLMLWAEENSQVQLTEIFQPGARASARSFAVTQILLKAGARCDHYSLSLEAPEQCHIGLLEVDQSRDSHYAHRTLALGSRLKRRDIEINLDESGTETELSGVYLLKNDEHVDFHTTLNHRVPHGNSQESFRGILGGHSRAVFNGRIHIFPDAQKTVAELSNKNLLLSRNAEVNTKPELEIYADDVRCAHGATIGQLDKQALHYCRSRGIGQTDAYRMLSHAFIEEVFAEIPDPDMREWFSQLAEPFYGEAGPA